MPQPKKPKTPKVNTSDCAKGQMHDREAAKLLFTTSSGFNA